VGLGVEALRDELLLDARVPKVLDLVVRAPGQVLGDLGPPASTQRPAMAAAVRVRYACTIQ
jgi:hypothetical protein